MEDWLQNIELPEVRTVIAFETESLIQLGLTIFITAVLVFWAYKRI